MSAFVVLLILIVVAAAAMYKMKLHTESMQLEVSNLTTERNKTVNQRRQVETELADVKNREREGTHACRDLTAELKKIEERTREIRKWFRENVVKEELDE